MRKQRPAQPALLHYDGLHRLKTFHRGTLTNDNRTIETPTLQQGWVLDATGNWKNFTQHNQQQPNQALDQQRLHNRVNEITQIARTVGQNWATPAYDRNGNMTTIPQPADPTKTYKATYDPWNRLTKLEEQTEAGLQMVQENQYDGQTWRTIRKDYEAGVQKEVRHFYYTSSWQCIEERVNDSLIADPQYVWGQRYIDDLILRDRSVTDASSSSSSSQDELNERLYCLQDANWNVVAIASHAGEVVERYAYSAYGVPMFLNAAFVAIPGSQYNWETLFASYPWDSTVGINPVRYRIYVAPLGVWGQRDPMQYLGSTNLYIYAGGSPGNNTDPTGLQFADGDPFLTEKLKEKPPSAMPPLFEESVFQIVAVNSGLTQELVKYKKTATSVSTCFESISRLSNLVIVTVSKRGILCDDAVPAFDYTLIPRAQYIETTDRPGCRGGMVCCAAGVATESKKENVETTLPIISRNRPTCIFAVTVKGSFEMKRKPGVCMEPAIACERCDL